MGRIRFANNSVADAQYGRVRIGDFTGEREVFSAFLDENTQVLRPMTGAPVGPVHVQQLTLTKTTGVSIVSFNGQTSSVSCQGVTSEGLPLSPQSCSAAAPAFTVTGSSLRCTG